MTNIPIKAIVISTFAALLILLGCKKEDDDNPIDPVDNFIGFQKPSHFPDPLYHFETNPVTKDGYELGKKLFYDPILSVNSTISCGSCHIPTESFAQSGHAISHGVEDRLGRRNSPSLMNLAWFSSFFHEGGVVDLDLQPIQPITDHNEMSENMLNLPAKLSAIPAYKTMFKAAFGADEITNTNMLKALSQFMTMLISSNSKYDSMKIGTATYTALENEGYTLFQANCATCHKEPLMTDFSFRNNGITPILLADKGRYEITLMDENIYQFKVPSLRNLQYTAPYMHDGSISTIDQVLNHYNSEISDPYGTLDPILKNPGAASIPLNDGEKTALLAFLKTLNDRSFIINLLFAE